MGSCAGWMMVFGFHVIKNLLRSNFYHTLTLRGGGGG